MLDQKRHFYMVFCLTEAAPEWILWKMVGRGV